MLAVDPPPPLEPPILVTEIFSGPDERTEVIVEFTPSIVRLMVLGAEELRVP
jgi:hypothetical protein